MLPRLLRHAFFAALCSCTTLTAAQLEVVEIPGVTLRDNPLHDPAARPAAVLSPDNTDSRTPLPLVIYLPGWGGSSQGIIAEGKSSFLARVVDDLAGAGTPLRIAVVDGRSRYGGSQFLNSTATGRYADYVAKEVFDLLMHRYATSPDHPASCIVAGHSSGGYGALMLAMGNHDKFFAVVALSPDSDFEVTHKPLAQQASVRAVTPQELESVMGPVDKARLPGEGLAALIVGLCANYTPDPAHPGRFEWLYDSSGNWQAAAWKRWIDCDPLTAVRRHEDAFAPTQRVFLDGPDHDDFGANIGARKIYDVVKNRPAPVNFQEPAGRHSDHLVERLEHGLTWALGHEAKH